MSSKSEEKKSGSINHPEELEEYIQVTTPPIWVLAIAMIIFVLGLWAFCFFGTITMHTENGGEEQVNPITFLIN